MPSTPTSFLIVHLYPYIGSLATTGLVKAKTTAKMCVFCFFLNSSSKNDVFCIFQILQPSMFENPTNIEQNQVICSTSSKISSAPPPPGSYIPARTLKQDHRFRKVVPPSGIWVVFLCAVSPTYGSREHFSDHSARSCGGISLWSKEDNKFWFLDLASSSMFPRVHSRQNLVIVV